MLKSQSKSKKVASLFCAVILIAAFAVPAHASRHGYDYTFSGSGECWASPDSYYYKEDNEQNAYVSIKKSSNWNRGADRVYLWVQFTNDEERTSSNKYFTNYVESAKLQYTSYTPAESLCGLTGWHNNYNTSKTFSIGGLWTP